MTTPLPGWDCHAHLFGPYARYPLAENRSYTPPEAVIDAYLALLATLELGHGVLVHPSAYGADHRLLLDTLSLHPQLRGVAVLTADTTQNLQQLRDQGVRGLRFSHRGGAAANFAGSASLADLQALAPRLADAGLHAELWTDTQVLPEIAPVLRALPCPVVIDHMGGFDVSAGHVAPGFEALRQLLEQGTVWVKLCLYRNLLGQPEAHTASLGRPFHDALLQANPDQLLWGSDWPHLRVAPEPTTTDLLAQFQAWTPAALQQRILVDNPARRYD